MEKTIPPPPTQKLSFDNTEIAFAQKNNLQLRRAYYLFNIMGKQALVNIGTSLTTFALRLRLPIGFLLRNTIYAQFCGGETIEKCKKPIAELENYGVTTILDYGVEAKATEEDLENTAQHLVKTLNYAKEEDSINIISSKITGLIRFELLEKISNKKELSEKEHKEWARGVRRVKFICKAGFDNDIQIYFDAEESWIQPAIDEIVNAMMARYNQKKAIIFNTYQMYRHDRLAFLKTSFENAQTENYILGAKIVRGAYMEKERERAKEKNYESPIQPNKAATDRDFDAAIEFCIKNIGKIAFCNATHNENSCLLLTQLIEKNKIKPLHPHILTAQLYGMSDHISFNMAKSGYPVSKYLPYGPVKEVIPYLIRRANENTSVAGQMGRELSLLKKEMERRKLI